MEKLEVSRQKKNNMLVIMFDSQFKNKIIWYFVGNELAI
jgi:hypothetical protein